MSRIKTYMLKNLSNIPGWRTNREIVVIESDDWGSVRSFSKEAVENMDDFGLDVRSRHFNAVDCLESNADLECLFELLASFKDFKGNTAVFTPMCIMGNPDFEAISKSDFQNYSFQPLDLTMKDYPNHNRLLELWREGDSGHLFCPELHGREHINVERYMEILKGHEGKQGLRYALSKKSIGVSRYKEMSYPNYLGALHPTTSSEIKNLHMYLKEASTLFQKYLKRKPRVFVAPNAEEPKELESTLKEIGIEYINRAKNRKYPLGDGVYKRERNFVGKVNEFHQTVLTRNCFFEPVAWGDDRLSRDWIASCLKEIEIAFRWKKPAVISTHRVNYVGSISPENREKGLNELKRLLAEVLKKWPDVEFMSSFELGETIKKDKYS